MASFTATAVSGKFSADHTAFVCGFDLSHASVPASFWADVDADGETTAEVDALVTKAKNKLDEQDEEPAE